MNTSDLFLNTSNQLRLKVSGTKRLGANDFRTEHPFDNTLNRENTKVRLGEQDVISLDYADGVWQQTGPVDHNRFRIFPEPGKGHSRGNRVFDMGRDDIFYDNRGVLVVKEMSKGMFIDWLV